MAKVVSSNKLWKIPRPQGPAGFSIAGEPLKKMKKKIQKYKNTKIQKKIQKYKNSKTNTQIRIYKYKYTVTHTQIQIHKNSPE